MQNLANRAPDDPLFFHFLRFLQIFLNIYMEKSEYFVSNHLNLSHFVIFLVLSGVRGGGVFYTKPPSPHTNPPPPIFLVIIVFFKQDFICLFLFFCKMLPKFFVFSVNFIFSKCQKALLIFSFCYFSVIIRFFRCFGIHLLFIWYWRGL